MAKQISATHWVNLCLTIHAPTLTFLTTVHSSANFQPLSIYSISWTAHYKFSKSNKLKNCPLLTHLRPSIGALVRVIAKIKCFCLINEAKRQKVQVHAISANFMVCFRLNYVKKNQCNLHRRKQFSAINIGKNEQCNLYETVYCKK